MKAVLGSEVCVWGAGLVGYSLASLLANAGNKCLLVDIDRERAARINSGKPPVQQLSSFTESLAPGGVGNIRACNSGSCAMSDDHRVHFLCIPTAVADRPDPTALREVIGKIVSKPPRGGPLYIVIESTIAPKWLETVVHRTFEDAGWKHKRDYHVGCSPRRDVFGQEDRSMQNVAKVYGADSEECLEVMHHIYEPICGELHRARDAKHAVMTKLIENCFRYQAILLANELTCSLREFNMAEVLSLAATKWNMDYYHPSLGIGGYCVPLAAKYLAVSLDQPDDALFPGQASREPELARSFMHRMLEIWPAKRVVILGVSYAPGLKVDTLAPSLRLVRFLESQGCEVKVNDPFYSPGEIETLVGTKTIELTEELSWADTAVLMTAHKQYLGAEQNQIARHISPRSCIFDNTGKWLDCKFPASVRYVQIGGRGFYHD